MTIDEYKDLMLEDEINIGCYVEEDDLPDEIEEGIIWRRNHRIFFILILYLGVAMRDPLYYT